MQLTVDLSFESKKIRKLGEHHRGVSPRKRWDWFALFAFPADKVAVLAGLSLGSQPQAGERLCVPRSPQLLFPP